MRVIVISLITPYKENVRGTSALAYHLLKGRSDDIDVVLYTFNGNKLSDKQINYVARDLNLEVRKLDLPRWYRWMFRYHLLFLRIFLKFPFVYYITLQNKVVEEIKSMKPNLVWVNNEEMSRIVKQFANLCRIQLGPDVESFYYYRMMSM